MVCSDAAGTAGDADAAAEFFLSTRPTPHRVADGAVLAARVVTARPRPDGSGPRDKSMGLVDAVDAKDAEGWTAHASQTRVAGECCRIGGYDLHAPQVEKQRACGAHEAWRRCEADDAAVSLEAFASNVCARVPPRTRHDARPCEIDAVVHLVQHGV